MSSDSIIFQFKSLAISRIIVYLQSDYKVLWTFMVMVSIYINLNFKISFALHLGFFLVNSEGFWD